MKNFYALLALVLCCAVQLQAQDFPWPEEELGEPMLIEAGTALGPYINDIINADTTATGERAHQHYVLQRGETYWYTGRVQNVGYALMVTAEEGDGPLPVVRALGDGGINEAPRPFHAQGDIYLRHISMNGYDASGRATDNATVRLVVDSIQAVIRDCHFNYNRQASIRTDGNQCEIYVENSVFGRLGRAARVDQGFPFDIRGNFFPIAHFRNNTFYDMVQGFTRNQGTERYGTLILEHNTFVNTGIEAIDLGRPDSLVFRNNLFVNPSMLGDAIDGNRENFNEDLWSFNLDSNIVIVDTVITGMDTTINTELRVPKVEWQYNHIYVDPAVIAALPDSSTHQIEDNALFSPILADLIGDQPGNTMSIERFEFTGFPIAEDTIAAFIQDQYQIDLEMRTEMPSALIDITTVDFTYSTEHPAYTGSSNGQPVGDLTWWDLAISSTYNIVELDASVYPNPARYELVIEMEDINQVEIFSMSGTRMMGINTPVSEKYQVDISGLSTGMYILLVTNRQGQSHVQKFSKQ